MAEINVGRMTHSYDGGLVVFLIGMRINRPSRPDLWLPALRAMPRMLAELSADPDSGFLGYRAFLGRSPFVVQWWSSEEKLYAYASDPHAEHRPAWTAFNASARKAAGAVGVWHETYVVSRAETMYVSMPTTGLAAATSLVPVGRNADRAAARLAAGATTGRPAPRD